MSVRCAAILAGGASSRMGTEKALLQVAGKPLVSLSAEVLGAIFPSVIVVTSSESVALAASIPSVPDVQSGKGPLGGIQAALSHFQQPTFVVACDMPFLDVRFVRHLVTRYVNQPALVPESEHGPEPLHAIYHPKILQGITALLDESRPPSMRRVLAAAGAEYLDVEEVRRFSPDLRCFENWNAPQDIRDTPSL